MHIIAETLNDEHAFLLILLLFLSRRSEDEGRVERGSRGDHHLQREVAADHNQPQQEQEQPPQLQQPQQPLIPADLEQLAPTGDNDQEQEEVFVKEAIYSILFAQLEQIEGMLFHGRFKFRFRRILFLDICIKRVSF